MIRRVEVNASVVSMARKRIRNVFSNGVPVYMSVSGGKDSICLNEFVFRMCESGEIDKSLLTVEEVFRLSEFSRDDFLALMIDGSNGYNKAFEVTDR